MRDGKRSEGEIKGAIESRPWAAVVVRLATERRSRTDVERAGERMIYRGEGQFRLDEGTGGKSERYGTASARSLRHPSTTSQVTECVGASKRCE